MGLAVVCGLLPIPFAFVGGACWGFVLSDGTTHGVGDLLIPVIGLFTTGAALAFLGGSALAAARIPHGNAGNGWRPVAWSLFWFSLVISTLLLARGLVQLV